MIRRKRPNSSPNFGEKTLQFPAKTFFLVFFFSISATELHNLHYSTFACQMRLVKAAKASPHAKFKNLKRIFANKGIENKSLEHFIIVSTQVVLISSQKPISSSISLTENPTRKTRPDF